MYHSFGFEYYSFGYFHNILTDDVSLINRTGSQELLHRIHRISDARARPSEFLVTIMLIRSDDPELRLYKILKILASTQF